MNIAEIKELKRELEVALLEAFTDFNNKTGIGIEGVGVTYVEYANLCEAPERIIRSVHVYLEKL